MKKTIKFLLFLCLPLLLVACFVCGNNPVVAHALTEESSQEEYVSPSKNPNYNNLEYVIDSYDVEIVVGEDNVFFVTETITAYFNVSKHGIKRFIPYKNEVRRTDGSRNTYIAKIKNISVDEKFSKSTEQGNIVLTIGDKNKTLVKESKTYVISYSFDVGKDMLKDKDEFYFNIIGTNWDTVIGNVTFNISMPKEFDASKLGFSSGSFGDTSSERVSYTLNGNNIFGKSGKDIIGLKIDKKKDFLACKNNINVIRIDCIKSDLEYIKNSILHSELNNIFNLQFIDWIKCEEYARGNLVKIISQEYDNDIFITPEFLSKKYNLCYATINAYIKIGRKVGWVKNSKKKKLRVTSSRIKPIMVNNKYYFSCISSLVENANELFNIENADVTYISNKLCKKDKLKYKNIVIEYISKNTFKEKYNEKYQFLYI